jgi:hypothetical protein
LGTIGNILKCFRIVSEDATVYGIFTRELVELEGGFSFGFVVVQNEN